MKFICSSKYSYVSMSDTLDIKLNIYNIITWTITNLIIKLLVVSFNWKSLDPIYLSKSVYS